VGDTILFSGQTQSFGSQTHTMHTRQEGKVSVCCIGTLVDSRGARGTQPSIYL